jgi:hypothetical protein
MSCAYVYSIFDKKNKYESFMIKLGIFIRILMFIGFTIEFSHQRTTLVDVNQWNVKEKAMDQFSNFLFYGYLFIVGIYYIITMSINKFKGFFYTFDLAMTSIPLLYMLTTMIANYKELREEPLILIFVLSLFTLPYLFFKSYWKKNIKWYSIFFLIAVVQTSIILALHIKVGLPTVMAYLLIGAYDICRKIFKNLMEKLQCNVKMGLKIASLVFPLILIYSSVAAINVKPMIFSRKYEIRMKYNKNTQFTSLEEAKAVARAAVGSENGEVKLWQPNTEDFHNVYRLSINNYAIDVNGVAGKLYSIRYESEKAISTDKDISDTDLKQKTIIWLKGIGYTYDDNLMEMKISRENKKYVVSIDRKSSDGKVYDDKFRGKTTLEWFGDGQLYYASISSIFTLSDYNKIKIDENKIREALANWYTKLEEETPVYKISSLRTWYDLGRESSISVDCSNEDSFDISSESGKVLSFYRRAKQNSNLDAEKHSEFQAKAVNLAKKFAYYDTFNYDIDDTENYIGKDQYYLSYNKNDAEKSILIRLDSEGNLATFQQQNSSMHGNERKLYSDSDFKVNSNEAINKVSSLYKIFGIYSKRVKHVTEVDENGKQKLKWMVVVMPFNTLEHHIYFVDTENGEVKPLLQYKAGVKDVKR